MRDIRRWLTLLAVGLACGLPAAAQDIAYFVDTGPLRVRDQFLLNMAFLGFDPAPATVLEPGEWQVDVVLTATNTFAHSSATEDFLEARKERSPLLYTGGEGVFQLDAEVYRTAVTVRRGIGHRLQLEALIPVLDFQGGTARVDPRDGSLEVTARGPGDGTVLRASALMDERAGSPWHVYVRSPVPWADVLFLFRSHLGLTRDPIFADNVLLWLLEDSRPERVETRRASPAGEP